MSVPIPLSVRLVTSRADRNVTRELRSLRFRSAAPGGFVSCSFALDRPLSLQPDEIAYYGKVYVYDSRNGNTVWEGRLEDPGRSASRDGQVWDLTAIGPSAHTLDRTVPLVYVDRKVDPWTVGGASASANYLRIDKRTDEDGTVVLQIQCPSGATFVAGQSGLVVNSTLAFTGQQLARVSVSWRSGTTSSNFRARLSTSTGTGTTNDVEIDIMSGSSGTLLGQKGTGNLIPSGDDTVRLRFDRITSNIAGSDVMWLEFTNPVIRSLLKNSSGSDITTATYTADTVLASEVVNDLLGRVLTAFDGANASVATTSYAIEQLAYPDGVTAYDLLNDLMKLESGYFWAAWESNSAGKYRFVWQAWPSSVRYEASAVDGYDSQGSADGLYNAARVRYRDANGLIRTVQRTGSVPELTAAGLTREALIDLGDEASSAANAAQVGDRYLADHASAPNAGRLTIARPVLDLYRGCYVMPWEVQPGNLIRVRDVLPRVDALNPTARDAVTIFRISAAEYDAGSAAATLELDSPPPTVPQQMASQLRRIPPRRR